MTNYPKLVFNLDEISNNVKLIQQACTKNNIQFTAVVKGFDTIPKVVLSILDAGITSYADSRIQKIKNIKQLVPSANSVLIRIPMMSEVSDVVKYADISFNSELEIIKALNDESIKQNTTHKIVLMADMGDLREGFFDEEELLNTAKTVSTLSNLKLVGIATNLGCYGAIKPSNANLSKLVEYAKKIEELLDIKLEIVSGGGTSTLPLMLQGSLPSGITHLRCGEAITTAKEVLDVWGVHMDGIARDAIYLEGEIVEIKNKPSYPIGEMVLDAFGNKPTFKDIGTRTKALVAIGKKDIGDHGYINPFSDKIQILGSSSDHLVLDITEESNLKIGDIIKFHIGYGAMLYASGCDCVYKEFI